VSTRIDELPQPEWIGYGSELRRKLDARHLGRRRRWTFGLASLTAAGAVIAATLALVVRAPRQAVQGWKKSRSSNSSVRTIWACYDTIRWSNGSTCSRISTSSNTSTNFRLHPVSNMTRGPKVATIALAVSIVAVGVKSVLAQPGSQPDVRMLLNLDLFTPQPKAPAGGDDDSTLHQIQALRAMGYLSSARNGSQIPRVSTTNSGPSETEPPTGGRGGEVE